MIARLLTSTASSNLVLKENDAYKVTKTCIKDVIIWLLYSCPEERRKESQQSIKIAIAITTTLSARLQTSSDKKTHHELSGREY